MSTNAIETYYNMQYQSQNLLNQTSDGSSSSSAASLLGSGSSSSSSLGTRYSAVAGQVQSLLADVPQSGSKLTFQDIIDYRDQLQDEFEAKARTDLEALGVDVDADFALSYNAATDTVTASSSHPDKAIIDQYFADNADMRDLFGQVVTYTNLLEPVESGLTPSQIRTQLSADTMNIWFQDNLASDSLLGGYGNLLFSATTQDSSYFGVNLTV
ncbi:MAG: hypothetical protein AB7D57_04705 [Desulfovibrionaceae bacterium]